MKQGRSKKKSPTDDIDKIDLDFDMKHVTGEKECNCSMRIKLVGDGCSICNPEYWEEMRE